jgi:2-C-methyl-D-erythritol 4-phosphate cytidylyltransferase
MQVNYNTKDFGVEGAEEVKDIVDQFLAEVALDVTITDDAELVEASFHAVLLVLGHPVEVIVPFNEMVQIAEDTRRRRGIPLG